MKRLLPVIIAVLLFSCQGIQIKKKPEARIKNFDIQSISLYDITLLFDVEVTNPYPLNLKLQDIAFTFFIEGKQFFKTSTARGLKIKANGKESSIFTVNLKYKDIIKIIQDYTKKDYLNCVVDTVITIPLPDLPGLQDNIAFSYKLKKQIPAIKPSIKIANFKVKLPTKKEIADALIKSGQQNLNSGTIQNMFEDLLSGKKTKTAADLTKLDLKLKVNFDILMTNKTKAKLNFKKLNYKFSVNNKHLVDGITTDIVNKANISVLHIANEFSTKEMSSSLIKTFKKRKGSYSLQGDSLIQLPSSIRKNPLKLEFNEKGEFNF
ncbi:MAG: hypothetical protein JW864_09955 [Spirochaetes bacterium]|nr:hypothetical protein [Spirochaetota bacterium]